MKGAGSKGTALLPLALLVTATPAAARFAPDPRYRLSLEIVRDDGAAKRRFSSEYDIDFTRVPDGYRATMRLLPDSVRDSGDDGRFAALQRAHGDTPLVAMLDRNGRLLAVEAADQAWARLRTAIAATADRARDLILAAHDRATPAQRDKTLAGDLITLCAGSDAERRPGTRDTTLPAIGDTPLPVRETATRDRDSVMIVAEGGGTPAAATFQRRRIIDRRSGIVRHLTETRRIAAGGASATIVRTAMVSSYPSAMPHIP